MAAREVLQAPRVHPKPAQVLAEGAAPGPAAPGPVPYHRHGLEEGPDDIGRVPGQPSEVP